MIGIIPRTFIKMLIN